MIYSLSENIMDIVINVDGNEVHAWEVKKIKESNPQYFSQVKLCYICLECSHQAFFRKGTKHGHPECFVHKKGNYRCKNKHSYIPPQGVKNYTEKYVKKIFRSYDQIQIIFDNVDENLQNKNLSDVYLEIIKPKSIKISHEKEPGHTRSTQRNFKAILRYLIHGKFAENMKAKIKIDNTDYISDNLFVKFSDIPKDQGANEKKIYWGKVANLNKGINNYLFINSTNIDNSKEFSIYLVGEVINYFNCKYDNEIRNFVSLYSLTGKELAINTDYELYMAIFGKLQIDSTGKKFIRISDPTELCYLVCEVVKP